MSESELKPRQEWRAVYFIEAVGRDCIKIGFTDSPLKRVRAMQTSSPDELRVLSVIWTDAAPALESRLHMELRADHLRGEWFRRSAAVQAWIDRGQDPRTRAIHLSLLPRELSKGVYMRQTADETIEEFAARIASVGRRLHPELWEAA